MTCQSWFLSALFSGHLNRPAVQALPPIVVQSQAELAADEVPEEVATAEQLLAAVAQGRRMIRLVRHVDLRLQPTPWTGTSHSLGFVPLTTRSITVRPSCVHLKVSPASKSCRDAACLCTLVWLPTIHRHVCCNDWQCVSYKRVKGRSHTVEKGVSMHPHKPHATS